MLQDLTYDFGISAGSQSECKVPEPHEKYDICTASLMVPTLAKASAAIRRECQKRGRYLVY